MLIYWVRHDKSESDLFLFTRNLKKWVFQTGFWVQYNNNNFFLYNNNNYVAIPQNERQDSDILLLNEKMN